MRPEVNKELVVATFEVLATYNPQKTKEAGRPIFDEQDVCRIRFAGNKHTVGVFPAHEVFTHAPDEFGFEEPVTYAMQYNDAYRKFKAGDAQTVSGTPLKALPLVTPGKVLELKALNVHTVETLAALDGNNLKMLGMGGRDLKNQAIAYLEQAEGLSDAVRLKEELASRDAQIAALTAKVDAMGAPQPVVAEVAAPSKKSPFDDFEDADIVNWIKDADRSIAIDGRWGRKKLIEVAEELNAKIARKAA